MLLHENRSAHKYSICDLNYVVLKGYALEGGERERLSAG